MKHFETEAWVSLLRLTPGRRAYAARRTADAARRLGYDAIAALCEAHITRERTQLERQRLYVADRAKMTHGNWTPAIVEAEQGVDREVVGLRDYLVVFAQRPATTRGAAAATLLERYFAAGAPYYTQQVFEDEVARVAELLAGLEGDRELVEAATVADIVADLQAAHGHFADALATFRRAAPTDYAAVRDGNRENQRAVLDIIVQILAVTAGLPSAERQAQREALLTPLAEQEAATSALQRARRRVTDVDPTTGAPTTDPATDLEDDADPPDGP